MARDITPYLAVGVLVVGGYFVVKEIRGWMAGQAPVPKNILKKAGDPFGGHIRFQHKGQAGHFWVGFGLEWPDDAAMWGILQQHWFGTFVDVPYDTDWNADYMATVEGKFPSDLPVGASIDVVKFVATHAPPFTKDEGGVLDHDWDDGTYTVGA